MVSPRCGTSCVPAAARVGRIPCHTRHTCGWGCGWGCAWRGPVSSHTSCGRPGRTWLSQDSAPCGSACGETGWSWRQSAFHTCHTDTPASSHAEISWCQPLGWRCLSSGMRLGTQEERKRTVCCRRVTQGGRRKVAGSCKVLNADSDPEALTAPHLWRLSLLAWGGCSSPDTLTSAHHGYCAHLWGEQVPVVAEVLWHTEPSSAVAEEYSSGDTWVLMPGKCPFWQVSALTVASRLRGFGAGSCIYGRRAGTPSGLASQSTA